MRQVLRALRQPMLRSVVVALTLSSLMIFGGTALARLPGAHATVQPASTTPVKILAQKTVKLTPGQTKTLFALGPITSRAVCTDLGGGSYKLEIQAKSSVANVAALFYNGSFVLTSSYQRTDWSTDTVEYGFAIAYDVITPTGAYQHYLADVTVHAPGAACLARLSATTAG